jgi:hypothetical protein
MKILQNLIIGIRQEKNTYLHMHHTDKIMQMQIYLHIISIIKLNRMNLLHQTLFYQMNLLFNLLLKPIKSMISLVFILVQLCMQIQDLKKEHG